LTFYTSASLIEDTGSIVAAIAYIIVHNPLKTSQLKQFIVSIDEVELRAGLGFLSVWDSSSEAALESRIESRVWAKWKA
jgi:DNA/RNA endonuclease G (NUC1)